ncbi:helix-turn-helix transcriptional regulator [Tessaracoccus flavus]|uniref:Transcriptional regulator n=1 Tax=Tessaracoccus flavus TaxID=1610493 RepID=A0A1Q2CBH1_9ACTN|nr:helix-turn-helix transcriptional regulator [Tessaracoccus flavus]AQP43448.1 transcriptional regulator [Tessaracoccus flavus]SDY83731.1 putative transcriptional regulator [Tessaracoccus flavus]
MPLNKRMRMARVALDLTQQDLAKQVGVSRQTISMIEAGDHNPTLNLCIDICKSLKTDLNTLFWEESSK